MFPSYAAIGEADILKQLFAEKEEITLSSTRQALLRVDKAFQTVAQSVLNKMEEERKWKEKARKEKEERKKQKR